MQRFQKQSFVLTVHTCFKNVGVTRMYVVAGFRMLFDRGVNVSTGVSIGSGLVLGPPRFPISLAFPDICKWNVLQVTLYTMPFNCSFVGRSFGFLKTFPNVCIGLKAVLMFSRLKMRRTRSDTPFIYGIDAHAFGFSWVLGSCAPPLYYKTSNRFTQG